jgi:hypothetical protein
MRRGLAMTAYHRDYLSQQIVLCQDLTPLVFFGGCVGGNAVLEQSFTPEPGITIGGVSPYGDTNGYVWGSVTGVDRNDYAVAVYLLVRGGW